MASNQTVTSPSLSLIHLSAFVLESKLPQKTFVSLDPNNHKPGEKIVGFSLESFRAILCKTRKKVGWKPSAIVVDVNWVSGIALLESPDD